MRHRLLQIETNALMLIEKRKHSLENMKDANERNKVYRAIARLYSKLDALYTDFYVKYSQASDVEKSLTFAKEALAAELRITDKTPLDKKNIDSDKFNLASSYRLVATQLSKTAENVVSLRKVIEYFEAAINLLNQLPKESIEKEDHQDTLRLSRYGIAKCYLKLGKLECPNTIYPCVPRKLFQEGMKYLSYIQSSQRNEQENKLMNELGDALQALLSRAVALQLSAEEGRRKRNYFTYFCAQPEFFETVDAEEARDIKRQKLR